MKNLNYKIMKISITQSTYERVEKTIEVSIPEHQMYFWHNGIRRAYSVTPKWTSWNMEQYNKAEEIWQLVIVMVDPSDYSIEMVELSVHQLATILKDNKHPYQRLVDNILNYPNDVEYLRTKEQFEVDLFKVINSINEAANVNVNPENV